MGLITGLRRARHEDLANALLFMHHKHTSSSEESSEAEDHDGEPVTSLSSEELRALLRRNPQQCIILIGPYIVDATNYLAEHVGPDPFFFFGHALMAFASARRSRSPTSLRIKKGLEFDRDEGCIRTRRMGVRGRYECAFTSGKAS